MTRLREWAYAQGYAYWKVQAYLASLSGDWVATARCEERARGWYSLWFSSKWNREHPL